MENRNIIIAIVCAMFLMCTFFACSKLSDKDNGEQKYIFPEINPKTNSNRNNNSQGYNGSSYGGGFGSSSSHSSSHNSDSSYEENYYSQNYNGEKKNTTPPAILSENDLKLMRKKQIQAREKLRKSALVWLKNITENPDLDKQTIEKYKVKSHQGFTNGTVALRNKDYQTALKYFNETAKDPNASAVTKYFAINNIMVAAQQMKDIELYFIAARMSAMLSAQEDLSIIGVPQTTDQLKWVNRTEKIIKARNNPAAFNECVQNLLDEYKAGINKEEAEEEVRKEIAYYTELYKEMLQ